MILCAATMRAQSEFGKRLERDPTITFKQVGEELANILATKAALPVKPNAPLQTEADPFKNEAFSDALRVLCQSCIENTELKTAVETNPNLIRERINFARRAVGRTFDELLRAFKPIKRNNCLKLLDLLSLASNFKINIRNY